MTRADGQQTLDGMPRRLFSCTPARLAMFDCPRRYRMAYLDRPRPPSGAPWAHNSIGAAVHLALARWWDLPAAQRSPAAGAGLVRGGWQAFGFRDPEQSDQWRDRAEQWVSRYIEQRFDAGRPPVGVERVVATPIGGLAVSGRVDRIDVRGDEAVVVDYKTGRYRPDDTDARGSQALALYALAVRRTLRRACVTVELHHLPSGTIARHDHTDESLARHVSRAEATATDIQAATAALAAGTPADAAFPTAPSAACSWCDFRGQCPEGRRTSPDRDSWAALAEAS